MVDDRVLGHLAQRFAVSEENIATEALTWLLRRSAAARSALIELAQQGGGDIPHALTFTGQVGSPDAGRPDIVGTDAIGRARLIIEAKFAASLTDQQPNGYLKQLPAETVGVLLVVAPTARRETLWFELMRAVPELASSAPSPSAVPQDGVLWTKIGLHATLALISWRTLVTRVLDALWAADESSLAHDAEQLLSLTDAMDSAAFIPLRRGDLDERTARQISQQHVIVDAVRSRIAMDRDALAEPFGQKPSHGRIFYGWYLRSRQTGKVIWYGFRVGAWARHGLSPLWVRVQVSPSWSRQRLLQALSGLHRIGQAGMFEDDGAFLIPLTIPYFVGLDDVVNDLRSQLEHVISQLDAVIPLGEHPPPDGPDLIADLDEVESEIDDSSPAVEP